MTRQGMPAALIAVTIIATACTRAESRTVEGEIDAIPVRVVKVISDTVAVPVVATGTLGADEELTLGFKIGGVIARATADPGDRVRAGQLLAVLELREIDAAVERAAAAARKAERDAARARRLYRDSVIALSQMQDAETAELVARAALAAASFDRRYASIVAPGEGVVLKRHRNAGELVSPGEPVVVLASATRGYVLRVGLSDRDVVRVRRGDRARVRFDAYPGESFDGRITELGAAADPRTGTYQVEIGLTADPRLVSGLIGIAEIAPASGHRYALIPVDAVLEADADAATVFVLAGDGRTVERRQVRVARVVGDRVAIAEGLEQGARVVTSGAAYLSDEAAVEVVP